MIGDFIWTAFDYIGEASIGWCGYPLDKRIFPWNHANCGDLNLSGERRPQSYLRETLYGIYMGLATTFVLVCSNVMISLLRNIIPDKVRIPAYVLIIATFVTVLDMAMEYALPDVYEILGL